jgi:putative transposase
MVKGNAPIKSVQLKVESFGRKIRSERLYMKTSRYSDSQIMAILKQAESGVPASQLCREHGMSNATFYKWRAKYGGMDASLITRLKELEAENNRLKKMYADVQLDALILRESLAKKY